MVRVFCDFDGTVAAVDVGNALFRHFAGGIAQEIAGKYIDGTISARECLLAEANAAGIVTPGAVEQFIETFELDTHFREFKEFCATNNVALTILSDGLDFYIGRILRRHGIEDCTFFANHLDWVGGDGGTRMSVSFPHTDSECLFCGNCKRNHMLTLSGDDDIIVYVGDGISDRCPVRYADVVFAKKSLIKYCQEANISYYEFTTFQDVQRRLGGILGKKRIRKRREAEMARRDVFMQG